MEHHKLMVSTGTNKLKHHRPEKLQEIVSGTFYNFTQNFLLPPKPKRRQKFNDESNEIYVHLLDMGL